jgi:hypothetical protein
MEVTTLLLFLNIAKFGEKAKTSALEVEMQTSPNQQPITNQQQNQNHDKP